jgi:hypothetical protein
MYLFIYIYEDFRNNTEIYSFTLQAGFFLSSRESILHTFLLPICVCECFFFCSFFVTNPFFFSSSTKRFHMRKTGKKSAGSTCSSAYTTYALMSISSLVLNCQKQNTKTYLQGKIEVKIIKKMIWILSLLFTGNK